MGYLVNGEWIVDSNTSPSNITSSTDHPLTLFRNFLTRDGSSGFPPDPSRYHLYISWGCPFAHRTFITLKLKGLENALQISIVDPVITDDGWVFSDHLSCIPDPVNNFTHLRQVYLKSDAKATCRVTVPVLFDKVTQKIVNNESSEIIVMLNECFDGPDLYPLELKPKIDELNTWIQSEINSGVYKCGFASTQEKYDLNIDPLFRALDRVEEILGNNRYLTGNVFTLADVRLFTTLVRFDSVYYGHFKCNLKRLVDYENIWNYVREVYQMPGVKETVRNDLIKKTYYMSMKWINPTQVVPKGPVLDFLQPHNRAMKFESN